MEKLQTIVMAAGRASRFKTNRSKLTEKICGQEMILFTTKALEKLKTNITVIVGYKKEEIQKTVRRQHGDKIKFIEQTEQRGTAHALMCSKPVWQAENLLIMNADMPLVTAELLNDLWQKHESSNAAVTFVTAHNLDPSLDSYGKVMSENGVIKIIEARDYAELIKREPDKKMDSCCINAGIYIFKQSFLQNAIPQLQTSSVTGEFYITDLIQIASQTGAGVEMLEAPVDQIRGINTIRELWIAEQIKQAEIINYWMSQGVRFQSAQNSYVELNVTLGAGSFVGQGVQLYGNSHVEQNCYLEPFSIIDNSTLGKNTIIRSFSIIKDTNIEDDATIGPMTHINGSIIRNENKISGDTIIRQKAPGISRKKGLTGATRSSMKISQI